MACGVRHPRSLQNPSGERAEHDSIKAMSEVEKAETREKPSALKAIIDG
jgi:hypothetical protein